MQRRYKRLALAAVTTIAVTGTAAAQQPGIFGFYNPGTGQFQPAPVQTLAPATRTNASPETAVSRSGIFKVVITIAVKNGTAPAVLPTCYINVSHSTPGRYYSQNQNVQGTRVGDNAKCVAVINYKWTAANTASPVSISATAYVGNWSAQVPMDPIPLPANGATTVVSAGTFL